MRGCRILVCFYLLQANAAFALILSNDTWVGTDSLSTALSASGPLEITAPKDTTKWRWSADYGFSRATFTNAQKVLVNEDSSDFGVGITYSRRPKLRVTGGLGYSMTPLAKMTEWGPSAGVNYRFNRYLNLKLSAAYDSYAQSGTQQRTLTRNSVSLRASTSPLYWLSAFAKYTLYRYDTDVADFLDALDSDTAFGGQDTPGFISMVWGLPASSAGLGFSFYLKRWTVDLSESVSSAAVDEVKTWTSELRLSYVLTRRWELALGDEYTTSEFSPKNYVVGSATYIF